MEATPLQAAMSGWLEHGPLTVGELTERAVTAGLVADEVDDEGDGPEAEIFGVLERFGEFWWTGLDTDDELIHLASTFLDTGMTLTHRVSKAELAAEVVDLTPDLSVLDYGAGRFGLPLDDGSGSIGVDGEPGAPQLTGPLGWIERVEPGALLVFRRTDGVVSVEVLDDDEVGDGTREIAALREGAERWVRNGYGEEETPILMEAMALDATLFRQPVPPVGELLVAAGLERRGHEWGWAGQPWQTRHEQLQDHDETIRRRFGFDRCCDRAYDAVKEAFLASFRDEAIDGRALARDLGHGPVAEAFVHAHATTPNAVIRFAEAAVEAADGRHAAPAWTLLGLARLREPDPAGAFEALDAAVRLDPELPAAAGPLALLELDRGNLARAQTLVARVDVDPGFAEWIAEERARQSALRPSAGRNDPCPCGSGKKFKRCCADGGPLTLAQRVPFVLQRMARYATSPDAYGTLFSTAIAAGGRHDDVATAIQGFLEDPFVVDVAVHEGGLGEEYLEERGPLLAGDEVALIETVLDERRRLWEILAVEPGVSLRLRDSGTGDELTVTERAGTLGREPGELLLVRVAHVEDEVLLFGVPLVVPLRERDRVLRMLDGWVDADVLAGWYGSLSLPPRMANREGEELVLRRTVAEVADPDALADALDATYERDRTEQVWHETLTIGGDRVLRGTLRLDGMVLTLESNSEERQARLLDTVRGLTDLDIIEDGELDEADTFGPGEPGGLLDFDELPSEQRDLVARSIAEYEERWVDEPVPALGGLTPRQALDDPTRREDLFALLREMRSHEPPAGAVGMSVDRLQQLLDIADM